LPVRAESLLKQPARPLGLDEELASLKLDVREVDLLDPLVFQPMRERDAKVARGRL
jgi:hypothetical protein